MSEVAQAGLVIVGGSAAGVAAALEARLLDPMLPITLVSGEHRAPYARPSLMYLFMGRLGLRELNLQPEASWRAHQIERRWAWATAAQLSTGGGVLTLQGREGAEELPFTQLLLATGARARPLSCAGSSLSGVCGLWGLHDLAELTRCAQDARRAVVLGGGLIGAELSEMLLSRGIPTTQLVREARYAPHLLNEVESERVARELTEIGVSLHLGHSLSAIQGQEGRVSVAHALGPNGPARFSCELLAVAIGSTAELSLASLLGLSLAEGAQAIKVNERFETSAPGVFAAGDCAEALSPAGVPWPRGWVSAERQGRLAARAMLARPQAHTLLDLRPELIPQVSRFGRLTHTRVGAVTQEDMEHGCAQRWAHPKRPELVSLYERQGQLVGVSALGRSLQSAQFISLLAQTPPSAQSALCDHPVLQEALKGLKRLS